VHSAALGLEQLGDHRPKSFRGTLRDDRLARELYSEGAGIARCLPLAVAVPVDALDVSVLVRWARTNGYSLMPRGSASGMAAGAIGPGIAVDLSRMNHIGAVDLGSQTIRVGAGAIRAHVDATANAAGLRFPVDPSSGAFCTIGGMVGTNAAGARSLRFGPTRAWVSGLECVFDDGSIAWVRRGELPPSRVPAVLRLQETLELIGVHTKPESLVHHGVRKESSGYAIADYLQCPRDDASGLVALLVGSEGTLAFFTQIELALLPVAGATASLLAQFETLEAATECALVAQEFGASACELLDRTFLDVAASKNATGRSWHAEAVLLIEMEADNDLDAQRGANTLVAALWKHGAREVAVGLSVEAQHELWSLRHAASPILASLAPRLRSMQFIEDGCVPPANLPAYVRGIRRILSRAEFTGVIFGHAGDAHIHVNPLIDTTQPDWRDRVHRALLEACELTARLGGTLAGEHGDGRLRAPLLQHIWNTEALAAFANVKAAADPTGVLNAGCKVAPADSFLRGDIRYDPAIPPLSPSARTILDQVEQTRDWSRFRLGEFANVGAESQQAH